MQKWEVKISPVNIVTMHKFTNIYFFSHPYSYSTVWIMKICYGVMAKMTHFRFFPISPLIFATVQKFALDDLRDQQILIPTCEWGWAVVVPLLGETLEVEDLPGMVWSVSKNKIKILAANHHIVQKLRCWGHGVYQVVNFLFSQVAQLSLAQTNGELLCARIYLVLN